MRTETIIPVSIDRVWNAFTTTTGLADWFSAGAVVDMQTAGSVRGTGKSGERLGDTGVTSMDIVNYIEHEIITFKINLDDRFSETIRDADDHLQEIVQFVPLADNRTKIVSSMVGWGTSRIWDDAYTFFAKRNETAYRRLSVALAQVR